MKEFRAEYTPEEYCAPLGCAPPGYVPECVFVLEIFSDGNVAFLHPGGELDIAPIHCFTESPRRAWSTFSTEKGE